MSSRLNPALVRSLTTFCAVLSESKRPTTVLVIFIFLIRDVVECASTDTLHLLCEICTTLILDAFRVIIGFSALDDDLFGTHRLLLRLMDCAFVPRDVQFFS